ncbi:hypothetical protein [Paracoccus tibetensis]|uniref:hypothetical protein n=1 Tax=Paracoccus tibetensis TaxID=336292 RepID=UPI000B8405E7|nr:hypothetical protein [Paracoccus tibetensis]
MTGGRLRDGAPRGQVQQTRQRPVEVDRQGGLPVRVLLRHQLDLLDQRPQRLFRLLVLVRLAEAPDQLPDPHAVGRRHARVEPQGFGGRGNSQFRLQRLLAPEGHVEPVLDPSRRHPADESIHQLT